MLSGMTQGEDTHDIGAILQERRRLLNVSREELSQQIQVPTKHLIKIEKSQWHALPSPVYTKGFIRRYAEALGMDADRIVAWYEADSEGAGGMRRSSVLRSSHERSKSSWRAQGGRVATRVTRRVAAGVVFLAVLGYIIYQLSIVFATPALVVTSPAQVETITQESTITLSGTTDAGITLLLNNQAVQVGPNGMFSRTIELLPGINTLDIAAVSRFGQRTTVERTVIYQEPVRSLLPQPVPAPVDTGTTTATGTEDQ